MKTAQPRPEPILRHWLPAPISDYPCKHCGSDVELIVEARPAVTSTVEVDRRDGDGTEHIDLKLSQASIWKCSGCPWQGTEAQLAIPLEVDEQGGEQLSFKTIEGLMRRKGVIRTGGGNKSGKRAAKPGDKLLGRVDYSATAWNDEVESRVGVEQKTEIVRVKGVEATTAELKAVCAAIIAEELQHLASVSQAS